jgi:gentisate 1,2-dioxygenase
MRTETTIDASKTADFYQRLEQRNLGPLWEVVKKLVPQSKQSKAVPNQWRYDDVRTLLLEAERLVTAEEAERRVLVMENPSFRGQSRITSTLFSGFQLISPGEIALTHRHTVSAFRLMMEGDGVYTVVEGEKTTMEMGDFVLTPPWAYHDHGNDGKAPGIWLDGLDAPITGFFEQSLIELSEERSQKLLYPEGSSVARFGEGLSPMTTERPFGAASPIVNYRYRKTKEALLAVARMQKPDPYMSISLRYTNPNDGGWALTTIATWMTFVPKGFETSIMRSGDGMVMVIIEGSGSLAVENKVFDFGPKDVHAVPAWSRRSIRAAEDCFIFCFSDRAAQEKLSMYAEERK